MNLIFSTSNKIETVSGNNFAFYVLALKLSLRYIRFYFFFFFSFSNFIMLVFRMPCG